MIGYTGRCVRFDTIVGYKDPRCVLFTRRRKGEENSPGDPIESEQKEEDDGASNAL